ncbi:MAG: hypothetical protein QOD14_484, partial [Solirubrobacterales bacterium]|nr:hypothetical protein [Solirubrobacterales bacterium]
PRGRSETRALAETETGADPGAGAPTGASATQRRGHPVGGAPPRYKRALPKEGSLVGLTEVAGAGFEPATFGL